MERIRDEWNRGMTWRQPRPFVPEFELRRGGHLFAALDFEGWNLQATAQAHDRSWTFERPRLLSRQVQMVHAATGHPALGIRLPGWRRATLETPGGRRYTCTPDWSGTEYRVQDDDGEAAVTFSRKLRLLTFEADVAIDARLIDRTELPELVVAGWYLATIVALQSVTAAPGLPSRRMKGTA